MLKFAHRGASAHADENTLEAILLAFKKNADGCEIDLRLSASGELVVIHDDTVDRTTDGSGIVEELTLKELQQLTTTRGFKIPTLDEVLHNYPKNKILNLEFKGAGTGAAFHAKWDQYKKSGILKEQLILSSFSTDELDVCSNDFKKALIIDDAKLVTEKRDNSIYFSVHLRGDIANEYTVQYFDAIGLEVYVWTIKQPSEIKRLINSGVHGIFVDDLSLFDNI